MARRSFSYGALAAALVGLGAVGLHLGRQYLRRRWQARLAEDLQGLADSCLVDHILDGAVSGWLDSGPEADTPDKPDSDSGDRRQDWDDCTEEILDAEDLKAFWA